MEDSIMTTKEIFPQRLKTLREEHGLSQTELAIKIGISRGSISFYENGSRIPDIEILSKMQDFFNVSFDFLLGKSNNRNNENVNIGKITGLSDKAIKALNLYLTENNSTRYTSNFKKAGVSSTKIINLIIESDYFYQFLFCFCSSVYHLAKYQEVSNEIFPNGSSFEENFDQLQSLAPKGYAVIPLWELSEQEFNDAKTWLDRLLMELQDKYLSKYYNSNLHNKSKQNE